MRTHVVCAAAAGAWISVGWMVRPAAAQMVGATIPVEAGPKGVAVNPTTRRVYVANNGGASISVIDTVQNAVLATIPVAPFPHRIAANPATDRVYVVHEGSSTLSVIDGSRQLLEGMVSVGGIAGGLAVNPTTNRIYVALPFNGSVAVINGVSNTVEGALAVGSSPKELVVDPITNRLYIANMDGTLTVVEPGQRAISDALRARNLGVVSGATLIPANNRIYLTQQDRNALVVVDGTSGSVLETVAIPAPDAVAVNPTTGRVFVTSGTGGTVTVLDSSNKIVATVPVAGKAVGVAVNSATGRAYVTLQDRDAVAVLGLDFIPPTVETTLDPVPNSAGWNNTDVTVHLKVIDNATGSAGKQLAITSTGAQPSALSTIDSDSAAVRVTRDGPTTLAFRAVDSEGNAGAEQSVIVYVDKTAPRASYAAPDESWHTGDVSLPVTVEEFGSGLMRAGDASFSLVARLPEGEEGADVSTDSSEIEDIAGNKITVGPVRGIKIDRKAPSITLASPAQRVFLLRQPVTAEIACRDGGSGVASWTAPGLRAGRLDTSEIGARSLVVTAKDHVDNEATETIRYQVTYDVRLVYNPNVAVKRGQRMVIKLQLRDAAGVNLSASTLRLTAQHIDPVQPNGLAPVALGQPFAYHRVAVYGSIYSLTVNTKELVPGRYVVTFTVGSDPFVYTAPFSVR